MLFDLSSVRNLLPSGHIVSDFCTNIEVSSAVIDEFVSLLCGLVEVENNTVYVTDPRLTHYVVGSPQEEDFQIDPHFMERKVPGETETAKDEENIHGIENTDKAEWKAVGNRGRSWKENKEQKKKQRKWYVFRPNGHTGIAETCLTYLYKHDRVGENSLRRNLALKMEISQDPKKEFLSSEWLRRGSMVEETLQPAGYGDQAASLLSYAIEHWFDHIKQSRDLSAVQTTSVSNFLADDDCVDHWIRQRASHRLPDSPTAVQQPLPRLGLLL